MTDDERDDLIADIARTLGDISVAMLKLQNAYETLREGTYPERCYMDRCRERAGRDGLCEKHHPGAIQ